VARQHPDAQAEHLTHKHLPTRRKEARAAAVVGGQYRMKHQRPPRCGNLRYLRFTLKLQCFQPLILGRYVWLIAAEDHFGRYSHKKSTYQSGTFTPAFSIQCTRLEPMMATAPAKPVATLSSVHRLVEA